MKTTTQILTAAILLIGSSLYAGNNAEATMEQALETRIAQLSQTLKQYNDFKIALSKAEGQDREAVLRKICGRMQGQVSAVSTAVSALDTYLEIKSTTNKEHYELKRTADSISELKNEIEQLKRGLGQAGATLQEVVATK